MRGCIVTAVGLALAWGLDAALAQPRAPETIDGNVIQVLSGDTLVVVAEGVKYKVRLLGIDAPESGQDYFDEAIRVLSEKTLSRRVHVDVKGGDRSSGYLGLVKQGDKPINRAMVAEGAAWHDAENVPSPVLKSAQQAAQQQKLGLWAADEPPVAPWDFRGQRPDARALAEEKQKLREEEAAKAAAEFVAAWRRGAAPDSLLTAKGQQADGDKKKAPGALSGVDIKPGKVNLRGNAADVLLSLTKGDVKLKGKVKLRSEQKKWLVQAVEIGSPPAILDFENTKSTLDKLEAALDKGFQDKEGAASAGEDGSPVDGGKGRAESDDSVAASSESPPPADEPPATEPSARSGLGALPVELPAALGKATPRRGGMGARLGKVPEAPEKAGGEPRSQDEASPAEARPLPLDSEMDASFREFLVGWTQGDVDAMRTVVHGSSGLPIFDELPPVPGGLDGDAIVSMKLRRLQIGDTYLDALGATQTVGEADASETAALVASDKDAVPYRLVRVEKAWKVDFDHLQQRLASLAPPEEPPANPKFRNR